MLPSHDQRRSPELRLLVALCAAHPAPAGADLGELEAPGVRRRFLGLLEANAVDGLVLGAMERGGRLDDLAAPARAELGGVLATLRRRAAVWVLERDRVLAHLAGRDVAPVVLKGAALCTTHYPEPASRWFEDLDLLLGRDEAEEAIDRLVELGYRPPASADRRQAYFEHHYHLPLHHPGGFIAEVHWALDRAPSPFRLDPAAFLSGSVDVGGVRMPRPEHLVLHLVAQTSADGVPRMVRLVDLDRIVRRAPDLDWDVVLRECRARGPGHALWMVLDAARRLLATPVPSAVLADLRPGAPTRWHLGRVTPEDVVLSGRLGRSWAATTYLSLWLRSGWRTRLAWLRRRIRADDDPMAWLWEGRQRPEASRPLPLTSRLARLGKTLGFHVLAWSRRRGVDASRARPPSKIVDSSSGEGER